MTLPEEKPKVKSRMAKLQILFFLWYKFFMSANSGKEQQRSEALNKRQQQQKITDIRNMAITDMEAIASAPETARYDLYVVPEQKITGNRGFTEVAVNTPGGVKIEFYLSDEITRNEDIRAEVEQFDPVGMMEGVMMARHAGRGRILVEYPETDGSGHVDTKRVILMNVLDASRLYVACGNALGIENDVLFQGLESYKQELLHRAGNNNPAYQN
ncbi:MAG: hypothetical protein HQK53_19535, partial [Oligoflexia bacterium]|nr:hypothetical protein [Oligoflexia bacterium]